MGDLVFYGQDNASKRGGNYSYTRYSGIPEAQNDPFAVLLDSKQVFRELYLAAEPETGYIRDRNVFGAPITIEDTMSVSVRYQNDAMLSYCLVAYSPWEGLRVAITGTNGRIEMDIAENINHLMGDGRAANASKGAFKTARMHVYPMFGQSYEVDVPAGDGGQDGADPFNRTASHIDGAVSLLVGVSANESMKTGKLIVVNDLFRLPEKSLPLPIQYPTS